MLHGEVAGDLGRLAAERDRAIARDDGEAIVAAEHAKVAGVERDAAMDRAIPGDLAFAGQQATMVVIGLDVGDARGVLVEGAVGGDIAEREAGFAVLVSAFGHVEAAFQRGASQGARGAHVGVDLTTQRLVFRAEQGPELFGAAFEVNGRGHRRVFVSEDVEAFALAHGDAGPRVEAEALAIADHFRHEPAVDEVSGERERDGVGGDAHGIGAFDGELEVAGGGADAVVEVGDAGDASAEGRDAGEARQAAQVDVAQLHLAGGGAIGGCEIDIDFAAQGGEGGIE